MLSRLIKIVGSIGLLSLISAAPALAQYPSPTYNNLTILGTCTGCSNGGSTGPFFNGTGTNPFRVSGTTIVDSSRNGYFANLSISTLNGISPNYAVRDDSGASANVVAGGTGYSATGDLVTVSGGTCVTPPILAVDASGGVVGHFSVATRGKCSVPPSNPVSVTGGTGSGATFTLNWNDVGTVNTFAPPGVTGGPNGVQILGARAGENNQGDMTGLTAYGMGTAGSGLHNADGMGGGTGMTSTASENTLTGYFDGTQITTGSFLTFTGHEAGSHEYNGIKETFTGTDSGKWTINGSELVFEGSNSGKFLLNPANVVAIGGETAPGKQIFATVSGAANNGSGLCRLTVDATTGMATGDEAVITAVAGATGCNGVFSTVTIVDGTHIDLTGSAFGGSYTSGGSVAAYTSHALTNATLVGYNVLTGAAMRSAGSLVGVGDSIYTSLTTGVRDVAAGHATFGALTTGTQDTGLGDNVGNTLTTGSGGVLVGYGADVNAANASNFVIIGSFNAGAQNKRAAHGTDGSTIVGAGAATKPDNTGSLMTGLTNSCFGFETCQTITSGAGDLVLSGSSAGCEPASATTSNEIVLCAGNSAGALTITGAATPSTSVMTVPGLQTVTGAATFSSNTLNFTGSTFTASGCTAVTVAATTGALGCTVSDRRLKIDGGVFSDDDALTDILAMPDLHTYQFQYGQGPGGHFIGYFAQDVKAVHPGWVMRGAATDLTPDGTLQYDQNHPTPELVGAVKALSRKVDLVAAGLPSDAIADRLRWQQIEIDLLAVWCVGLTGYLALRRNSRRAQE